MTFSSIIFKQGRPLQHQLQRENIGVRRRRTLGAVLCTEWGRSPTLLRRQYNRQRVRWPTRSVLCALRNLGV